MRFARAVALRSGESDENRLLRVLFANAAIGGIKGAWVPVSAFIVSTVLILATGLAKGVRSQAPSEANARISDGERSELMPSNGSATSAALDGGSLVEISIDDERDWGDQPHADVLYKIGVPVDGCNDCRIYVVQSVRVLDPRVRVRAESILREVLAQCQVYGSPSHAFEAIVYDWKPGGVLNFSSKVMSDGGTFEKRGDSWGPKPGCVLAELNKRSNLLGVPFPFEVSVEFSLVAVPADIDPKGLQLKNFLFW
jgi:hypothetical protein